MKKNSHFKDEQNTFILKFEEIKEQVLIILEKLLKITNSEITTSHLNSMQTAIQQDCEIILQEVKNVSNSITENANALTSQSADLLLLKEDVGSLLSFVPSDLKNILNNIETIINELPSKTLSQTELNELESRLNASLTNLESKIISDDIGIDEPLNLEDRLKAVLSTIHSLCENIQISINENSGSSAGIEGLEAGISDIQDSISSMQNGLNTALQYIQENGTLIEPEAPFDPPPDTVLRTRSVAYPWRKYFGTVPSIDFSREYFVINNDASGVLKVQYDFEAQELIENIVSDLYLNDELVDTVTFNAEVGTKRIVHTAIFELDKPNGNFQVKINSISNAYRFISNIKYELVGKNAVLLRENLPTTYDLLLCGNEYYFTRSTSTSLDYMHTTVQNTDFNQDYQKLAEVEKECVYEPAIALTYNGTNQMTTLLYFTYMRYNLANNEVSVYDNETGTMKSTARVKINEASPDIVEMGPLYATAYQLSVALFQHATKSFNYIQVYTPLTSVSIGTVKKVTKNYVNFEYLVNTITPRGKSFYSKVVMICQDDTGVWHVQNRSAMESQIDLEIGFGTKAKFSYCTKFIGGSTTRKECFRVFMFVYDHWVAKYFEMAPNNITCTMLKAKVIEGDFDQILPGTGNEYFTVKDGAITKHIDDYVINLEEYELS